MHLNGCCFNFGNSEGMTSFPHNLVLDPQPRFGLTPVEYSVVYNFLISKPIFMKIVAKCLACVFLSYKVHVTVCNPIPLKKLIDPQSIVAIHSIQLPAQEPQMGLYKYSGLK